MKENIITLKVEDHDNFIYILADRQKKQAFIIDPAWDGEGIAEVLKEEGLKLTGILITHSHHDHVNAVKTLYNKNVSLFIHEKEYPLWKDCPEDAILLQDGDEISFHNSTIQTIHTPGHTAGSVCFLYQNHLFTGDTLFIYGCGRADLKGGDVDALYQSLQKLKTLPEQLIIHPGHDYGDSEESTLKAQKIGNPFLLIDNKEDFINYRLNLAKKYRQTPYSAITLDELQQQLKTQ